MGGCWRRRKPWAGPALLTARITNPRTTDARIGLRLDPTRTRLSQSRGGSPGDKRVSPRVVRGWHNL
ncbi:hypothetical protein PtB15_14B380 [Puccinia triticina]|nr:hypothetical protein PtB15_14B380 [Puccinia triticina]